MNYEVRTTQTLVRYYHVEASSKHEATTKVKDQEGLLEATIARDMIYDYAIPLTPEGEPIFS